MSTTNSFGYKEELSRSMNSFSSFAISFSLISVLTGIFANFNFGYRQVGGGIIWSWLLVASGQFFVALVMARLSIQYPIVGYGYQWASRLVHVHYGFFVGWILLIQFITGFPSICKTFATISINLFNLNISDDILSYITIAIISAVTLIHLLGIHVVTKVNDIGVFAEMIGVLLLILLLIGVWIMSGNVSLATLQSCTLFMSEHSLQFSSFALSLLLGAWGLTGFEAAADLAEETKSPTTAIPNAIMISLISSSILGFLILLSLVIQANGFESNNENLLISILTNSIGVRLTTTLLLFVLISIFACAVASMATASRLLYSFSRDKILPFSTWISFVGKESKSPKNAIIVIWGFSCLSILALKKIEIISSVSALASYIGYLGILIAAIMSKRTIIQGKGYLFNNLQRPVQWIALCWVIFVIISLSYPETDVDGFETKHLPLITTSVSIGIGSLIYLFYVRKKINRGLAGPPIINI
ncbi:MAG: amino acid permease [Bacteroidetes bacterium]|nr:amino acid permease [Bacteroidota bacterium]